MANTKRPPPKRTRAKSPIYPEADARGLDQSLHLRLHKWLMDDLQRLALLERRSVSNLGRHALEIGLRWYRERHEEEAKRAKR
jgi:hypothetical protein